MHSSISLVPRPFCEFVFKYLPLRVLDPTNDGTKTLTNRINYIKNLDSKFLAKEEGGIKTQGHGVIIF